VLGGVLESHVVVRRQTNTSAENVVDASTLLEQRVDDGCVGGHQRSLQQVRQNAQDGVEVLEIRHAVGLVCNSLHEVCQDSQIVDNWRSQKRVFTCVVHSDGVVTAHEDFRGVLVQSSLGVTNKRHVLDNDGVVWVFSGLVEELVRGNHVVDHVALGNFLGAELLRGRQVLAVVVTQVIVRDNRTGLETSRDQEINQNGLHLGLSGLEVITTNAHTLTNSQVNETRNEGVLRRTVDVRALLQDGSNSVQVGRRNLKFLSLDSSQQVIGSVVDSSDNINESFSVGGPEDDHGIQLMLGLEVTDVLTNLLNHLLLGSLENVIGSVLLVGGDEVRDVDTRERLDLLHVRNQLSLQSQSKT